MPRSIEPADRRPLVYGVFVLLILVAASYLFWPRSSEPGSLVLTPESVRSGSAAAELADVPTADERAMTDDDPSRLETVAIDEGPALAEEASISDEPPAPARSRPVAVEPQAPARNEPVRTEALASGSPSAAGDWVLNVGAFSTEASARERAEAISRQGMPAHVHRIVADGTALWRVRVGYFATKAKATEYGTWMQSAHGLEGWASAR